MKTIKIREKKQSFYFAVIFLPLLIIGFAYYVFLSGSPQVTSGTKYIFAGIVLYSSYSIYSEIKKRKNNIPALIISEFSIEIFSAFKASLHLWQDIKSWKIDHNDRELILETYNIKKTISVSGLDKTSEEIEDILNEFVSKLRSTT